jgi:hypothetical protein
VNESCDLLQIEQFGDFLSAAANTVMWLCESGHVGRFLHMNREGFSNYEQCCALEDALIDTDKCAGWAFVVGRIADDDETRAWLECGDEIVLPYGPARKEQGSDMGVWSRDLWDETDYTVRAVAEAGPDSGIVLNRIVKALGYPVLGGPE